MTYRYEMPAELQQSILDGIKRRRNIESIQTIVDDLEYKEYLVRTDTDYFCVLLEKDIEAPQLNHWWWSVEVIEDLGFERYPTRLSSGYQSSVDIAYEAGLQNCKLDEA